MLPSNVVVDEDVLTTVFEHVAISMVQSAVIEDYWKEDFSPILQLMPHMIVRTKADIAIARPWGMVLQTRERVGMYISIGTQAGI